MEEDAANPGTYTFTATAPTATTIKDASFDITVNLIDDEEVKVTELSVDACVKPTPQPECK